MFLSAVQTHLETEAYRSREAFNHWIDEQTAQALEGRAPNEPALVAFPELIGLPLLFHLERRTNATRIQEAALEIIRANWLEALKLSAKHLRFGVSSFLLSDAVRLHSVMLEAFSNAAKKYHRSLSVALTSCPRWTTKPRRACTSRMPGSETCRICSRRAAKSCRAAQKST
ncbi:MAG: hypothetical protein HC933_17995 [Pleurocapsa sp. SU_196_0]|nr:hypothetical protein [Pleurocapsa sp. SU_196_0]